MCKICSIILAIGVLSVLCSLNVWGLSISVTPALPDTLDTVSVNWHDLLTSDGNQGLEGSTATLFGNTVELTIEYYLIVNGIGLPIMLPVGASHKVGCLPAGNYTVYTEVWVHNYFHDQDTCLLFYLGAELQQHLVRPFYVSNAVRSSNLFTLSSLWLRCKSQSPVLNETDFSRFDRNGDDFVDERDAFEIIEVLK